MGETESSFSNAVANDSTAPAPTLVKPKGQIGIQLDDSNYLLWKFQIETAINGYGLEEYINGTIKIPPKMIADGENLIANKEYISYHRQDSLLATWLMSSISTNILSQIIGCKSSHEIWTGIEQIFNSQSAARVIHYKRQLQNLRKDNMTMGEYLTKTKTLCDLLATAGHRVSEAEQILNILSGLNEDYESVVTVIASKKTLPDIQYVHSSLLAHEGRIEQRKPFNPDLTANFVATNRNKIQERTTNYRNDQTSQRTNQTSRCRGRGRWSNSNNRVRCQICEKPGHTAGKCYFRFDHNFTTNQLGNNQRSINANIAQSDMNPRNQASGPRMQADTEAQFKIEDIQSEDWYPDSGATNHITNNLNNLNMGSKEYKG